MRGGADGDLGKAVAIEIAGGKAVELSELARDVEGPGLEVRLQAAQDEKGRAGPVCEDQVLPPIAVDVDPGGLRHSEPLVLILPTELLRGSPLASPIDAERRGPAGGEDVR